ncbi:MAG: hydrolase [Clostridiaceae bacterium]|nr:hydrolase [Clostridiaceae bacterium]
MDNIELIIRNGDTIYYPVVQDTITWETERRSSPGKLTFSIVPDKILNIEEGNPVRLKVNDTGVFYGFLFSMSRNKDNSLKITAYDQLRYLKNKGSRFFNYETSTTIIQALAWEYNLNLGSLADTEYVFDYLAEDNQSLFDIIEPTLQDTERFTNKNFVLYDDFGKLTLKNIEDLKLSLLYDNDTIEDFDYSSSIDENTYNKIELAYDNKDTGQRDKYVAQDSNNINSWGILQYYNKENSDTGLQEKANALLNYYNQKTKKLSLKNAIGDLRVRAGSSIVVKLDLADTNVYRYMLVDKAKHTFNNGEHFMDLTLIGGAFNAV